MFCLFVVVGLFFGLVLGVWGEFLLFVVVVVFCLFICCEFVFVVFLLMFFAFLLVCFRCFLCVFVLYGFVLFLMHDPTESIVDTLHM